jgi:hypothetical protein
VKGLRAEKYNFSLIIYPCFKSYYIYTYIYRKSPPLTKYTNHKILFLENRLMSHLQYIESDNVIQTTIQSQKLDAIVCKSQFKTKQKTVTRAKTTFRPAATLVFYCRFIKIFFHFCMYERSKYTISSYFSIRKYIFNTHFVSRCPVCSC